MSVPEEDTATIPTWLISTAILLPGGGVRIILITDQPEETVAGNSRADRCLARSAGRPVEMRTAVFDRRHGAAGRVDPAGAGGVGPAPLVLITTAVEPLTPGRIWNRSLEAIDRCDHAVGRQAEGPGGQSPAVAGQLAPAT